ncbi:acetate kinase [uncultured Tyzzerella sp.]|uniref:acetate/propionate family kinase n=1 Tax=uncultured Tyzzerella sp. TaxID=2321398 RepID=UPI0029432ACA|nr:acetate kinase [uncultured Tyzzerella sp.]
MKVLVLNCGSSSLKYQLIDMSTENPLASGLCERIGIDGRLKHKGKEVYEVEQEMKNHEDAIKMVIDALLNEKYGVISDIKEINAVGHRVVHGGEHFAKSVIITDEVIKAIEDCIDLAPLHNPANLMGIRACESLIPGVAQVAVFDTAFHQTMPEKAYLYGIPYELYEKYKIRRYGFHGTSHKYVSERAASVLGKDIKDLKIITCHLGNGGSVAAINGGKCMDTSMGFTPLEGLVMGTRCGDIDPAVVSFIMEKENLNNKQVDDLMNKKSGVLGLSGVSSDFRDIEGAAQEGNKRAQIALDTFHYKVAKYIGEYTSTLNGVDAIVFTAGLGENSKNSRKEICSYLSWLGIELDEEQNSKRGEEVVISVPSSKIKVLVIPTNEELVIARDTKELLDK